MQSLLNGCTNINKKELHVQYDENSHIEYNDKCKCLSSREQRLIDVYSQLKRHPYTLQRTEAAKQFVVCFQEGCAEDKKILLKMLAYTRDIREGMGEYAITFAIIKQLLDTDTDTTANICNEFMRHCVGYKITTEPLGSWKDMKYLFNELGKCPPEMIKMMNSQLKMDASSIESFSLVAKWIPREKSKKFGWIYTVLAKDYFSEYGLKGWNKGAVNKAKTKYRQLVSSLNSRLDTVQMKQCSKNWSKIQFKNVTGTTLVKDRVAFLNNNKGDPNPNNEDREVCRNNLLNYILDGHFECNSHNHTSPSVTISNLVKNARFAMDESEQIILNAVWKSNGIPVKPLPNVIAFVDTSSSMYSNGAMPLYTAIGLGCRITERSSLGNQMIVFGNRPEWVHLNNTKTFCERMQSIYDDSWEMNTDFYKAVELLLDTLMKGNIPVEEVESLTLVVFSDMKFDHTKKNIMNDIQSMFYDAGIKACGSPYNSPHILFWNVNNITKCPIIDPIYENVAIMNGYSPRQLNESILWSKVSPNRILFSIIEKDRYKELSQISV